MSVLAEQEKVAYDPNRKSNYYILPVVFDSATHVPWVMGTRTAIPRQGTAAEQKEQLLPQFLFEPFQDTLSSEQITSKRIDFVDFATTKIKYHMSPLTTPFTVLNASKTTFQKSSNPQLPESISGFIGFQALVHYPLESNQDPRYCYGWSDWMSDKTTYLGVVFREKIDKLRQVKRVVQSAISEERGFNNPVLTIIIPLQMTTDDINSLRTGDHPLLFSPLLFPDVVTPIDLTDETFLKSFPYEKDKKDLKQFATDIQALIELQRLRRQKWWESKHPSSKTPPPETKSVFTGKKEVDLPHIPIDDPARRQIYSLDPFTVSGPGMKVKLGFISFQVWMFLMRKMNFAWRHAYSPESLTWPAGFFSSGDTVDASYDDVLSTIGVSSTSEWFRITRLESVVSVKLKELITIIEGYTSTSNRMEEFTSSNLARFFVSYMLTGNTVFSPAQIRRMLDDVERRLDFVSTSKDLLSNKQDAARRERMQNILKFTRIIFSAQPPQLTPAMLARRDDIQLKLFYYLFCFTRLLVASATEEIMIPAFDVFRLIPLSFLSNSKPFTATDVQPVYYREYSFNSEENVKEFTEWTDEVSSVWNALSTADMMGGADLQKIFEEGTRRSLGIGAILRPIGEYSLRVGLLAAFLFYPEQILPQVASLTWFGASTALKVPAFILAQISASVVTACISFLWYTYKSRKLPSSTSAVWHHYYRLPILEQEKEPLRRLLNQPSETLVMRLLEPFGQTLYITEDSIHDEPRDYQRFRSTVAEGRPNLHLPYEKAWANSLSSSGRDSLRIVHTWLKAMEDATIDYYLFNHPGGSVEDIPIGAWIRLQRFSTEQMDVDSLIKSTETRILELESFIQKEASLVERIMVVEFVELDKNSSGRFERRVQELTRIREIEILPDNKSKLVLLRKTRLEGVSVARFVIGYEWSDGTKIKLWNGRRTEMVSRLGSTPPLSDDGRIANHTAKRMLLSLIFACAHQIQTMDFMDFVKSIVSSDIWIEEIQAWTAWFGTNDQRLGWNGRDASFHVTIAHSLFRFLSLVPMSTNPQWTVSLYVRHASLQLEQKVDDLETAEGNVRLLIKHSTDGELLEEDKFTVPSNKTNIRILYDASNWRHGPFLIDSRLQLWQFIHSLLRALNMKLLAPFPPGELWEITSSVWDNSEFQGFLWKEAGKRTQVFRRIQPWRSQFDILQKLALIVKRIFFVSRLGNSYEGIANLHLVPIQDEGKLPFLSKDKIVTNYRIWADMVGGVMGYCYPEPSFDADWANWNFLILPFEIHTQEIGGQGNMNVPTPAIDMETFVFGHQKYIDTTVFSSPFVTAEQLLIPSTIYTIVPPSPAKVLFRPASNLSRWFPTFPSGLSIAESRMTLMWLQYLSISPTTGQPTAFPHRIFDVALRDNIQKRLSEMRVYLLYSRKLALILIAKRPNEDEQQIQIPNIIIGQSRLLHMVQDLFDPALRNIPFPYMHDRHPWARLSGLESLWPLAVQTGVITFRERFNFVKGAIHHYYENLIYSKVKKKLKEISWWNSFRVSLLIPVVLYNMYVMYNSSSQLSWLYNVSTEVDFPSTPTTSQQSTSIPPPSTLTSDISAKTRSKEAVSAFDESQSGQSVNEIDLAQRSQSLFTDNDVSDPSSASTGQPSEGEIEGSNTALVPFSTAVTPHIDTIPTATNTLGVWLSTMAESSKGFYEAAVSSRLNPEKLAARYFINTMAVSFAIQESDLFLFRRVNVHEDVPVSQNWWTRRVLGIEESELSEDKRRFLQIWRKYFVPAATHVAAFGMASYVGFYDEFVWSIALTTLQSIFFARR